MGSKEISHPISEPEEMASLTSEVRNGQKGDTLGVLVNVRGSTERVRGRWQPSYDQHFDATTATVSANRTYRRYNKFNILCTERGEGVAWAFGQPLCQ